VAPVEARRVRPEEDANDVAAEQVRVLIRRVPERDVVPLFVFDAGYDPVRLQKGLEGCRAQLLVRLHSGRTFYADPKPPFKRPVGRPFRHGKKFDLKDPSAWHMPTCERLESTADYGTVRVRAWSGLHPKTRRAAERYGSDSARVVAGTVALVEVGRLPRGERRRKPKALWLWWHGPGEPDLDLIWRAYCRRFDVEHFVKFLKGTLGWTTPRVRHPEQADRWTWLVPTAYAQLRLAQGIVADQRLPWERPLAPRSLTPTRCCAVSPRSCPWWARRRGHRNPAAGRRGDRKVASPAPPGATRRRSRRLKAPPRSGSRGARVAAVSVPSGLKRKLRIAWPADSYLVNAQEARTIRACASIQSPGHVTTQTQPKT
jgi:hypothetical protein